MNPQQQRGSLDERHFDIRRDCQPGLAGITRDEKGEEHATMIVAYPRAVLSGALALATNMSRMGEKPVVGTNGNYVTVLFRLSDVDDKARADISMATGVDGNILRDVQAIMTGETEFPNGIGHFEKRFARDRRFRVVIVADTIEPDKPIVPLWTAELTETCTLEEVEKAVLA